MSSRITRASAARQAGNSPGASTTSAATTATASSTRSQASSRKRKASQRESSPAPEADPEPPKPSSARRTKRPRVIETEVPSQPPVAAASVPSRRRNTKGKNSAVMSSPGYVVEPSRDTNSRDATYKDIVILQVPRTILQRPLPAPPSASQHAIRNQGRVR